jgi:hypothetical protein
LVQATPDRGIINRIASQAGAVPHDHVGDWPLGDPPEQTSQARAVRAITGRTDIRELIGDHSAESLGLAGAGFALLAYAATLILLVGRRDA